MVDAEFIDDLPERLQCFICLMGLKDPQLTSCGHRACSECFAKLKFRRGSTISCPVCRTETDLFLDTATNREVLDLPVKCNQPECAWTGEARDWERHRDVKCKHVRLPCSSCGDKFLRSDLNFHEQFQCPKRKVQCKRCQIELIHENVKNHCETECPNALVPCPQQCGESYLRCKIDEHMSSSGSCPMSIIECSFHYAGCSSMLKRQSLDKHLQENVVRHLSMLSTKFQEELRSIDFTYHWRIRDWAETFNMTKTEHSVELKSDLFYIGQPGPNAMLKLTLNSDINEVGVCLIPTEGKYDFSIPWPFQATFSIAIVDQRDNGRDVVQTMTKKTLKEKHPHAFMPSHLSASLATGFHRLISFDGLRNFIKDDSILVKLTVYRW